MKKIKIFMLCVVAVIGFNRCVFAMSNKNYRHSSSEEQDEKEESLISSEEISSYEEKEKDFCEDLVEQQERKSQTKKHFISNFNNGLIKTSSILKKILKNPVTYYENESKILYSFRKITKDICDLEFELKKVMSDNEKFINFDLENIFNNLKKLKVNLRQLNEIFSKLKKINTLIKAFKEKGVEKYIEEIDYNNSNSKKHINNYKDHEQKYEKLKADYKENNVDFLKKINSFIICLNQIKSDLKNSVF